MASLQIATERGTIRIGITPRCIDKICARQVAVAAIAVTHLQSAAHGQLHTIVKGVVQSIGGMVRLVPVAVGEALLLDLSRLQIHVGHLLVGRQVAVMPQVETLEWIDTAIGVIDERTEILQDHQVVHILIDEAHVSLSVGEELGERTLIELMAVVIAIKGNVVGGPIEVLIGGEAVLPASCERPREVEIHLVLAILIEAVAGPSLESLTARSVLSIHKVADLAIAHGGLHRSHTATADRTHTSVPTLVGIKLEVVVGDGKAILKDRHRADSVSGESERDLTRAAVTGGIHKGRTACFSFLCLEDIGGSGLCCKRDCSTQQCGHD